MYASYLYGPRNFLTWTLYLPFELKWSLEVLTSSCFAMLSFFFFFSGFFCERKQKFSYGKPEIKDLSPYMKHTTIQRVGFELSSFSSNHLSFCWSKVCTLHFISPPKITQEEKKKAIFKNPQKENSNKDKKCDLVDWTVVALKAHL